MNVIETVILGRKNSVCKGSKVRERHGTLASSYRGLRFSVWVKLAEEGWEMGIWELRAR